MSPARAGIAPIPSSFPLLCGMPKQNNTTQPAPVSEDADLVLTLRPTRWEEYIGQEKVKANLKLILEAAKQRKESCDHLLFYGQAGLGKTTLAYLVGKEMGASIRSTSGPALEKAGDLAAILSNIEPNEVLFIDEAHRVNKLVEEILYPAMESRKLHLIVGKGVSARTFSLDLPPFTIIAATTKANLLSSPLRSRFGAIFRLEYYTVQDIEKIIQRSATILGVTIAPEAAQKIVEGMTHEYKPGEKYEGTVTRLMDFGAFVKIGPNAEGMVHISEIAPFRIDQISSALQEGDVVPVMVKEIDEKGRINLSIKAADPSFAERKGIKPGTGMGGGGFSGGFRSQGGRPERRRR